MKLRFSPQDKKRLSYEKDRRNIYGECGSHSRHAIATHKARDHRSYRRRINEILQTDEIQMPELLEDIDVKAKSVHPSQWRKSADSRLGEVVRRKLERRKKMGINVSVKKLLIGR